MRIQTFLPVLALLGSACSPAPDPGEQLFNGKDMTGWRHVGKGEFVVQDGLLKTVGGMGLLAYDGKPIGNAVLRVVYKPENPLSNAGVFIRIPEQPQDAWYPVHHGYEVQIQDDADEFHRTGSIYSLSQAETFRPRTTAGIRSTLHWTGKRPPSASTGKWSTRFGATNPYPSA
ncbi:MAG: DUF1080 domain-containing protein [Bryobacterales bacterium]